MKEIKPYKVALFVAGIFLVLTPIVYFIPSDGWKLGNFPVKFLTQEKMLHPVEQQKADITDLLANIDTTMNEDAPVSPSLIKHSNGSKGNMGAPSGGSEMVESATDLLMNETGKANLLKFFTALETAAADRKKISILHYGDSQIEGDRMTNFIRERIQNQFGGNGPGLIPAKNVYDTYAFNQTTSENFERYTAFGGSSLKSRKYGAMASAARFTPEYTIDSTFNLDKLQETKGWIEISASGRAYTRARSFNNVKMHYNGCVAPTLLRVLENGKVIHEDSLIMDGKQHTVSLSFPSTPGKLRYEFTGKVSPNICAFSLEGDYGVQVSNIGMRGSSGTVFTGMNQTVASAMYNELNTRLVIMQFGGNSVPFFKDSASVRNFASFFKSQINTVQRLNPNAMIIVIGPSDMSVFKDGQYESYKYLSYCVEQMIAVTKSSGGAYWNLYAAMGGNNSMPSWVEKGLAGKDYIHFSNGGTKIASQLFYNALMEAYNNRNSL